MRRPTISFALVLATGCTSFATVRSAEVLPGPSLSAQGTITTPVPDVTGWFWSFDCARDCAHLIPGGDLGITYGIPMARPIAVGVGLSGSHPYVDAYVQLLRGERPAGIGARFGPPLTSWREHQLYARYDIPAGRGVRLLLNPALFVHEGHAPNGESPGRFVGFVQGFGFLVEGERVSYMSGVSLVVGRAQRTSYGETFGPERAVFGEFSFGMTWHGRRSSTTRASPAAGPR